MHKKIVAKNKETEAAAAAAKSGAENGVSAPPKPVTT
jgi:hypothetical protein